MYEREIELIEARLISAGLGVDSGEAWQTLKTAVLAQQTNNTGSPKLPTLEETLAHFNCDQELYTDGQRLTHGLIERCYNFICRQLRAGA